MAAPAKVVNLGLGKRAEKALVKHRITTTNQLCKHDAEHLLLKSGIGETVVENIRATLAKYGLGLKGEEVPSLDTDRIDAAILNLAEKDLTLDDAVQVAVTNAERNETEVVHELMAVIAERADVVITQEDAERVLGMKDEAQLPLPNMPQRPVDDEGDPIPYSIAADWVQTMVREVANECYKDDLGEVGIMAVMRHTKTAPYDGKCQPVPVWVQAIVEHYTADQLGGPAHVRWVVFLWDATWYGLNEIQQRALIDHELHHAVRRSRDHDITEFIDVVRRRGAWSPALKELAEVLCQATLPLEEEGAEE